MYGTLITQVDADLKRLDQKLDTALNKWRQYNRDAKQLANVRMNASGRGGGGVSDEEAAMRGRMADLKTRINLQRYLDSEERKISVARASAEREQQGRFQSAYRQEKAAMAERTRAFEVDRRARADAETEVNRMFTGMRAGWRETTTGIGHARREATGFSKVLQDVGKRDLASIRDSFDMIGKVITGGLLAGAGALVSMGINLNREFQQQQTTLAAILGLTTDIVDKNGRILTPTEQLTVNLGAAKGLYSQIRKEAAETILETQELARVFSSNLGLAVNAGLKVSDKREDNQALQVISRISQLAKTQGLFGERQLAQESRALLSGEGLESGTVARILGITSKTQITKAIDKGEYFAMLKKKLDAAQPAIDLYGKSFDAIFTTLITKGKDFLRLSFAEVFERITGKLFNLNEVFTDEKVGEFAKQFGKNVSSAYDAIQKFFESDGFKQAKGFFHLLVEHGETILKIFLGLQGVRALNAGAQGVRGIVGAIGGNAATSAVGGALPGIVGGTFGRLQRISQDQGMRGVFGSLLAGAGARFAAGTGGRAALLAAGGMALNAVPIVGAGVLAGKTMLDLQHQREDADRNAAQRGSDTADMLRDPELRRRFETRQRLFRARGIAAQFQAAGNPAQMMVNTGTADEPRMVQMRLSTIKGMLKQAQRDELGIAIQTQLAKAQMAGDDLKRIAKESEERKKARLKELLETRVQLAKLSEDKIGEIRASAELEKFEVREKVKSEKLAQQLVEAIERDKIRRIARQRNDDALAVRKQVADLTNNKIASINAEADADAIRAGREIKNQQRLAHVLAAIEIRRQENVRREKEDTSLDRSQRIASNRGDEFKTIQLAGVKELNDIGRDARDRMRNATTPAERNKAFREAVEERRSSISKMTRELIDKEKEYTDRGKQLSTEFRDTTRKQAQDRVRYEKELGDLQRRTAREAQQLLKERIQAEKDLKYAQTDRVFSLQEIELSNSERKNKRAAERALEFGQGNFGIEGGVERHFMETARGATSGEKQENAKRQARQQLLELRNSLLQPGGAEDVTQQLEDMGVRLTDQQRQSLQSVSQESQRVEGARETQGEAKDIEGDRRKSEDANRTVETAQQRLSELDERQAELRKGYYEAAAALREQLTEAVKDNAATFQRLNVETRKFLESISNLSSVRPTFAPLLGDIARGVQGAQQAAATAPTAPSAAQPVNINIGEGFLGLLSPDTRAAAQDFADLLQRDIRKTTPGVRG
jgi:hypothetical protein